MSNPFLASFENEPALLALGGEGKFKAFLDKAAAMMDTIEANVGDVSMEDDFWPSEDSWLAQYRPYKVTEEGILVIPVKGVLMNKATGEPLLADGKEIRSSFTFKPDKPDGEINITFVFDASGLKTATEIVVFETLYRDDTEIAAHADLKDEGQTVKITPPTPDNPQTGDNSNLGFWIGLGAVTLGGLVAVIIIRVKSRKDEDDE